MIKVLVVEDNIDVRDNIIEVLELAGYDVVSANNGKAGVDIAMKTIPDIILCDIMMPELDGYGVLYMLNKHENTRNIPFIFISAKSERGDQRKGMEMGADDYLIKPFNATELLHALESRLKKKNDQKQFYSKSLERLDHFVDKKDGLPELKKIISERKSRTFKRNQVIHHEGDHSIGVYLVMTGKVKSVKLGEDGRELMTGIYQPEDFLGLNSVLNGETYADTATALEDCELCFFPKAQVDELLSSYPDIAGKFLKILSNKIRDKDDHLVQLAYQSVRKRIAQAILRLFQNDSVEVDSINISRDDLAALSGTASETVSRTLTEFKNEGLIEKKGSCLTILDRKKITNLKN